MAKLLLALSLAIALPGLAACGEEDDRQLPPGGGGPGSGGGGGGGAEIDGGQQAPDAQPAPSIDAGL